MIYAFPADAPDRFGERSSQIASSLNAVDTWWRGQDPARTPRLDLAVFPGCATTFGALDISSVRLPHPTSYYHELTANRSARLRDDLRDIASDLGKKYFVFYDGPVETGICGEFLGASVRGGPYSFAFMYVQADGCPGPLGAGTNNDRSVAHELLHSFGAVSFSAPHFCGANHVCDRDDDVMYDVNLGRPIGAVVLDAGRDDYYAHGGSWEDARRSDYLRHLDAPTYRLDVRVSGPGSVRSENPGIECPPACDVEWDVGSSVRLRATPAPGMRFLGWDVSCGGEGDCVLTMNEVTTLVARFAPRGSYRVTATIRGHGIVTSSPKGITCPGRCAASFPGGVTVRLSERPAKGWKFAGWGGACESPSRCTVDVEHATSVRARFVAKR